MERLDSRLFQPGAAPVAIKPTSTVCLDKKSSTLIIVERRALMREFISTWINGFQQEFDVISAADAEVSVSLQALAQATMIILGVSAPVLSSPWVDRQITWIRANRADIPIVAILDVDEDLAPGATLLDTRLQGRIPTSSSIGVAAAALQLVAAGGLYFPRAAGQNEPPPDLASHNMARQGSASPLVAKLTPRERAVLELLEQGMANKIIAYRLSLSQSTVKAHVHSIISKLNVRNRTEAAVTSQHHAESIQTRGVLIGSG